MRVIVALLFLFVEPASACVNTYETDILLMMHRGDSEEIAQTIRDLEATNAKAPSVESRNDLAVAYIIAGKYQEAVTLLTDLEKEHPGISRTASNLGTALELSGKNAEALRWIEEGIARDPSDHRGTEWLHAKILQAKVAIEKDPAWLETHNVLDVDFGSEARPHMPSALEDRRDLPGSLEEIGRAIDYQLKERLKFVTAPDPIVANLYRTRADIAYLAYLHQPPSAFDYYSAATFFGAKDNLTQHREQMFRIDSSAEGSQSNSLDVRSAGVQAMGAVIAILLLLVAGLTFRLVRRPSKQ